METARLFPCAEVDGVIGKVVTRADVRSTDRFVSAHDS